MVVAIGKVDCLPACLLAAFVGCLAEPLFPVDSRWKELTGGSILGVMPCLLE
jgi:hypothetical protein